MDRKQSSFTQVSELEDSDFLPAFGSGTNKKISKSDFIDQLKDEAQVFVYPTIAQLQQANLAADPDWPIYVRVEETEYRLYKITSLAAGANDIPLDNGATATFQEEYSEIGFVVGPSPSVAGAVALFDGETGTQLKNGPVMGAIGKNIASLDSAPDTSFIKINPDNSVSLRNTAQFRTDLSISNVDNTSDANKPISDATQNALDGKVSGPASSATDQVALFDGITGKLIKAGQTLAQIFDVWLAQLYNIFPRTINTCADIATTTYLQDGQVFYLKEYHAGTGVGGGAIKAFAGSIAPDNGFNFNGVSGFYFERINFSELTHHDYGIKFDGSDETSRIDAYSAYLISIGKSQTLINSSFAVVASQLASSNNPLKCVITGDSLSFNAYGYTGAYVGITDGGGYATDNPFGLMSWAHMLRDFWLVSNPTFKPMREIRALSSGSSALVIDENFFPRIGMGAECASYVFSSASESLEIEHSIATTGYLIVSYEAAAGASTFYVDGIQYDNQSPTGHYQNAGYMFVPCAAFRSVITTAVRKVGTDPAFVRIYGFTTSASLPKLTGKGGYTSQQVLSEYNTLVRPYTPNVIFYIIGANDTSSRTYNQYITSLNSFIDEAQVDDPLVKVVLLTLPPSSSYTDQTAMRYVLAARHVAESRGHSVIDLYHHMLVSDPASMRFDNIHFNEKGDNFVFSLLKELVFATLPLKNEVFNAQRGWYSGYLRKLISKPTAVISQTYFLGASPSLTSNTSTISNKTVAVFVGAGATSALRITAPLGYICTDVSIAEGTGADSAKRIVRKAYVDGRTSDFALSQAGAFIEIASTGYTVQATFVRTESVAA